MKIKFTYILACLAILYTSCKKDLGNYTYNPPSSPVVENIEGENISALIGDSLIIKPEVSLDGADPMKDLNFEWRIMLLEELRELSYTGYPFKMLFNLGTGPRAATLVVTDKRNGLIYKYKFTITGITQFSAGTIVLSSEGGTAKLSFVKPDNTVLANIYENLQERSLPKNPVQLYYSKPLPYQLLSKEEYWVLCNDPANGSVIVNPSTFLWKDNFKSQFFLPPSTIVPGRLETFQGTISQGVLNGKLYIGVQSTAPFAPDYGKFSNEQKGDYNLSPFFTHTGAFYFGYDTQAKAFVYFDGGGNYNGTNYEPGTAATPPFNPKNTGLSNLVYLKASISGTTYAFFREADGNTYELTFDNQLTAGTKRIIAQQKRVFKGSAQVQADSKWIRSSINIFYFSSNDKIYRYNPINEDLRVLEADFGGKKVSMLKISGDDNTLTVGVEGAMHTLDVSVGKNGNITKSINGIPGAPVDFLTRTN
ncbi:PKD-like family lipoprotein [Pedobacter deserti]|uniref:PKD-like family lipoprotein n=1 Tax=Pedobacter deserti TaxID=2817382 RepID=UPI0021099FB2|nr:PKD-like family lipoprotein [Pedobacter sp. SYSU D00382]